MVQRMFLGHRLLVVEDEYFVARDILRLIVGLGAEVVGPIPSLGAAWDLLGDGTVIDGAVLDVDLNGELVFPLADELLDRGTPFLLATGYGGLSLPERFRRLPHLCKPFDDLAFRRTAERIFAAPPVHAPGGREAVLV